MIEIGALVKEWLTDDFGIVIDHWTHQHGEKHPVIKWITGCYVGETDAMLTTSLEMIV